MPFIKTKFNSYHDFAIAELDEIYTKAALQDSQIFAAKRLESVLLINDGNGKFEIRPLPRLAQASPGFGVVMTDLNADGHADIYVVQNFMEPQPETGQMDGGLSLLLDGDGTGVFRPVRPAESGLIVTGQGMGLATVDLNRDGWPDLVVSTNNGRTHAFLNKPQPGRLGVAVRLVGQPGNLVGVGSRVTMTLASGQSMTAEVYAGSGYLSQLSGELFFGCTADDAPQGVRVRWPNGEVTTEEIRPGETSLVISRP